jgi:putative ABC transport system ATP-binding protein
VSRESEGGVGRESEGGVGRESEGAVSREPDSGDRTAQPAIEAVDVTRGYQLEGVEVPALRGVSVRVDPGEYAAILGPSGSGKSTLMHLLGCLDRPTSGTLRIAGRDVARLSDHELARLRNEMIGFVFQSFHLLARTSALDNVALPLVYRGIPRAEGRRRATAALETVGLAHRVGHRPGQLSGGEQQRVAIARALVGDPQVVLADEPTGNLDTRNGHEVIDLLDRLNAERGVAIVLVTHEPDVAARARRQIHIRDGLIESDTATSPAAPEPAAPPSSPAPPPSPAAPHPAAPPAAPAPRAPYASPAPPAPRPHGDRP